MPIPSTISVERPLEVPVSKRERTTQPKSLDDMKTPHPVCASCKISNNSLLSQLRRSFSPKRVKKTTTCSSSSKSETTVPLKHKNKSRTTKADVDSLRASLESINDFLKTVENSPEARALVQEHLARSLARKPAVA